VPIYIRESPEPLSDLSYSIEDGAPQPILISSDAARQLRDELRLYCSGDTAGRSFLIAGHRGAGKSTLVANAFLQIWKECERGTGGSRRPLLVPLNGPSLFMTPAEQDAENENEDEGEDGEEEKKGKKNEAQVVLEQIVLGLHRAVAHEFSYRYRKRAQDTAQEAEGNQRPGSTVVSKPHVPLALAKPGMAELCAQFDADLLECPEPARLREYYSYARRNGSSGQLEGILGREWALNPQFQAAAELLALSGMCEAYKRISGDFTRTDNVNDQFFREMERTFGREATIKDYVAPLMPLFIGGVAGVGAGAAGSGGLAAAGAGVIAALGSAAVVKYTNKRTITKSRVENFIFDLSLATLDRVIPVLVDRLWNAGLAPMFVIDELDKVDNLGQRMQNIVHHLKKLVAENAFFCFVADREYFEGMLRQGSNHAYPKEYTYYSRRLFTVLEADDFDTYLRELLVDQPSPKTLQTGGKNVINRRPGSGLPGGTPGGPAPNPSPSPSPGSSPSTAPGAPSATTVQAGQFVAGSAAAAEATMRELLIWILRHRSQLHPLDLRRQLTTLRAEEGYIKLSPGDVQHPMYLIDVSMQVFIEALLNDGEVINKVAGNHEELRLIHDALYYVTREWLAGAQTLQVNAKGKEDFENYLERRTGLKSNGTTTEADKALSDHDRLFLFGLVARLAEALADTDIIGMTPQQQIPPARQLIENWERNVQARAQQSGPFVVTLPVRTEVKNAILQGKRSVLEVREKSDPTPNIPFGTIVYEWRYEPSGIPRDNRAMRAQSAGQAEPGQPPSPPSCGGAPTAGPPPSPTPAPSATPASAQAPRPVAAAPPAKEVADSAATAAQPSVTMSAAKSAQEQPPLELVSTASAEFDDVESFIQMLNRAIGVPKGEAAYIRYEMLADQLRIMPTSPSWETVRAAAARLATGAASSNVAAQRSMDEGLVQDFVETLNRTRESIVNAIACASVIGAATEDGEARHRVVLGLQILSQGLRLHEKQDPAPAIAQVIKDLRKEFRTVFSDSVIAGGGGLRFPRADGWRQRVAVLNSAADSSILTTVLEEELRTFVTSPVMASELRSQARWQSLLNDAWTEGRARAVACLIGTTRKDAHVSEMICFARNDGPAMALTFRFPDLSATTFTNLLCRTLESPQTSPDIGTNELPAWVGLAALHALGFGTFDPMVLAGLIAGLVGEYREAVPVLQELSIAGLVMGRRPPDTSVIAITRPETLFASWPVRSDCLFLAGRPREISKILELPLHGLIARESVVLAIEMERGSETLPRDLEFDERIKELRIVETITARLDLAHWAKTYIYTQQPTSKRAPSPALVSPKSLEEVLGSAFRNVPLA